MGATTVPPPWCGLDTQPASVSIKAALVPSQAMRRANIFILCLPEFGFLFTSAIKFILKVCVSLCAIVSNGNRTERPCVLRIYT